MYKIRLLYLNPVSAESRTNFDFDRVGAGASAEQRFRGPKPTCPGNHGLRSFSTPPTLEIHCDACAAVQRQGTETYSCRQCNYDLCKACYDKLASASAGVVSAIFTLRQRLEVEQNPFECERLVAEVNRLIERTCTARRAEHKAEKERLQSFIRRLKKEQGKLEKELEALETRAKECRDSLNTNAELMSDWATKMTVGERRLASETTYMQSQGGEALKELLVAKHKEFASRWRNWSEDDVAAWVGSLEQGRFMELAPCFQKNGIDGKELASLKKMEDLADCGVERRPERRALWAHRQTLLQLQTDGLGENKSGEGANHQASAPERPAGPADCAICMDRPGEAVFAPCGHRCCCAECARELKQKGDTCPICRKEIQSVAERVFG
eukprot:g63348.t1